MTKNFRKVLSILLALSLVLGLCPDAAKASAFNNSTESVTEVSTDAVQTEEDAKLPENQAQPAAPETVEKTTDPVRPTVPELKPLPITLPEIEEVVLPAQSFADSANGVDVSVSAPEGAFPEGTRMVVKAVDASQVEAQVREVVDGSITKMLAVDISFVDADGNEIEPLTAIEVSMTSTQIKADKAAVVHIPDAGQAQLVKGVELSANKATFMSEAFSVYVVVETGEDARLTVEFVLADGTKKTMMINKRQIPQIDQYIFVPGANAPEGSIFKGWTTVENYDSSSEAKTIAEVREDVKAKLEAGITDGDKVTYYAMVFNAYKVVYQDERGILVKVDQVLVRVDDETKPVHEVTLSYTPYPTDEEGVSAEFMGWQQLEPQVTGEMVLYQPGDSFTLEQSQYILKAYTQKGHWLSFDENLSGASYTEPQFIAINGKPTEPADPTRTGYTFDGWYTADASSARDGQVSGDTFDFSAVLNENKTVYAKWTKANTANYSVVIWKQNVDGEHYDYAETVPVNNATVGNNTYEITERGTGVRISTGSGNVDKSYSWFHVSETKGYDSPKAVAAEGNTVINVYFDRDTITYNFRYSSTNTVTFSGLYGSSFTKWPDPGNGRVWTFTTGSGWNQHSYTLPLPLTEFNPAAVDPDTTTQREFTFTLSNSDANLRLNVYKQTTSGTWSYTDADLIATARLGGGTWYPTETYIGFTLDAYYIGNNPASGTWRSITPSGSIDYDRNFNLRYTRNQYSIVYNDGIFVNGSGNPVEAINRGELAALKEAAVYYEADITGMNKTPEYGGFVFLGWYDNEYCVGEPYAFTTMPAHNVTLYAKWGLSEYTVNLHANDSTDDPIKYTSATQATTFYIDNGEKIGNVGGERIYSDLIGWYSDPEFKHPFDFDSFTVNTQMVEKYGKLYSADEIDPRYPTTIGELNLYAKWRSKLIGADGITVEYVDGAEGKGTTVTDEHKYVDGAEANANEAFAPADPDTYVFSHWEVQRWNGTAYEASGVKVFPGDTFEVLANNAKITDADGNVKTSAELEEGQSYTYTIQVKAVYIEKDKEVRTFINWYNNYDGGKVATSENIAINEATPIPAAPTRAGYKFLGWIRGIEEDGTTTTLTDLWLTYEDGKYLYEGKEATHVAADEMLVGDGTQHHALYAKWEAVEVDYTVEFYYQNEAGEYEKDENLTATRQAKTDTEVEVTAEDKAQTKNDKYVLVSGDPSVLKATVAGDGSTVLKLYFDLNKVDVTVEHYLKGQTTAFKTDTIKDQVVTSTFTATPETTYQELNLTVNNYDPSQAITVKTEGNLIKIYYTLPLTITAATKSKTYDGKPLEGEYTIEGALDADKDAIVALLGTAPSITNVSESPKDYLTEEEQAKITGIPEYYVVSYKAGKLTINPITEKVTVTITEDSDKVTYDGEEHTIEGYKSMEADNDLYDVKTSVEETKTDAWTVTKTEAGTYDMGITANDFKNTNQNFTNVEFVIVDGQLIIEKSTEKVTVTITEKKLTVTYDGKEHTITGYESIVADNALYDVTKSVKETKTDAWTVTKTDAGTYDMGIVAADFENTDPNFSNVEFVIVDGQLVINPITDKVTVTITENSDEVTYDGAAHTIKGYKSIESDNELYVVEDSVKETETADWTVTKTDAGTYDMGIVKGDFENINKNFANVEFVIVDGQLKINPISDKVVVTITENSDEVTYDGQPHTIKGYKSMTADNDLYKPATAVKATETAAWTVTETDAGTYDMGIVAGDFENIDKNFTNVVFEVVDGQLIIEKRKDQVTVTITENSGEYTYDGKEHSISGYKSIVADNELYDVTTAVKETKTDAWTVTETDAGTYDMGIVAADFENIDKNFENVVFVIVDGQLVINPIKDKVTVTITENKGEYTYDGKEHTITGYATIESDNELYVVKDSVKETKTDAWTVTETDAGTYDMGIVKGDFENINKNFTNVEFVVVDGQLKINPVSDKVVVTITENSDEVTYDGQPHTIKGYASMVADNDLYKVATAVKETETEAWTVTETNAGTYDMGIVAGDFENIDKNFTNVEFVIVDGQLKINPVTAKVTVKVTEKSDEVTYDGQPHTIKGYKTMEADNDLYDVNTAVKETETDDWTVTKTETGSYDMGILAADFENIDKNFTNVVFEVVDGKLIINPTDNKVTVTITENSDEVTYDGQPHTIKGYLSIVADNPLYDVTKAVKETETAAWTVTETNAGTYDMGIVAADFENTDPNFTNVEFVIVDGQLKINPISDKVVVTITENSDEVTYDGEPHTIKGYKSIVADNKLYDVTKAVKETETDAWTVTETNAGTYDMGIVAGDFENIDKNFTNVEFVVVDGQLKINPVSDKVVVTITENSDEVTYDGQPHTIKGYATMVADNDLYKVATAVKETETEAWTVTETNAGTYDMGIVAGDFENIDKNFTNVEFVIVDGQLKINPVTAKVTVKVTEKSDEVTYDGQPHTIKGYTTMVADNDLYKVATAVKETETEAWTVTETNAGTYDMGIVAGDFENIDKNFTNVVFEIIDGQLKINPVSEKVVVTITENSDEVTYDGQPHTIKGYATMVADNDLYKVATAVKETETEAWTVTETDAGTYDMGILPADFENLDKNFANVEFVIVDGQLVINPTDEKVTVTVTENNDQVKYDGAAHTIDGYKAIVSDNDLYVIADSVKETKTAAWTVKEVNAGTYEMGIVAADFENINKNFTNVEFVIVDGTLTIDKRALTLTSATDEKVYDGTALTNDEVTIGGDGLADTDTITFDVTGSQTYVGSSANTFTYEISRKADATPAFVKKMLKAASFGLMDVEDEEPAAEASVADNYDITVVEGTLTVTDDVDDSDVIVKTHDGEEYGLGETVEFIISVTNIYDEPKTITIEEIEGVTFTSEHVFENVAPGMTVVATAEYVVTEEDLLAGTFKNTATATFSDVDKPYEGEDEVDLEDPKPHVTITKEVTNEPADGELYKEGETIEYLITVENDGNLTVYDLKVTDELTGDEWTIDELAPGASEEFKASYKVTPEDAAAGKVLNVATGTGTTKGDDPEVVPGEKEVPVKTPEIPKTSDDSQIFLWASMLTLSIAGIGFTMNLKKREEEDAEA